MRSSILELLDAEDTYLTSVAPATIDGRPMLSLRIKRGPHSPQILGEGEDRASYEGEEDFYLDPARGYAQVRQQIFDPAGNLLAQTDCSDFADRGISLPLSITYQFSPDAKPLPPGTHFHQSTVAVSHISFDAVPADKFVPTDTKPGTWFTDEIGGTVVVHVLQKDGSLKLRKQGFEGK